MDRQTLTLVAVIVCMLGIVVMFKELKAAKEDVEGLKGFSMNVMKRLQPQPTPTPMPVRVAPPAPVQQSKEKEEEVAAEESEEK